MKFLLDTQILMLKGKYPRVKAGAVFGADSAGLSCYIGFLQNLDSL